MGSVWFHLVNRREADEWNAASGDRVYGQTHQLVREHLPGLATDTVKVEGSDALTTIRVFVDSDAKKSNKKARGAKGKGAAAGQSFYRTGDGAKAKYVAFTLYKENIDTMSVVNLIARLVRVKVICALPPPPFRHHNPE
jgi:hypothetical protein